MLDRVGFGPARPLEYVVSALHATGTRVEDPTPLLPTLRRLSHLPYQAPTPAGYPDRARDWIDPGAVLERTRFAFRVGAGRVRGPAVFPGFSPRAPGLRRRA